MAVRDVVQAAAGQGGDKLYVEDVFSTYLYTGNSSSLTITNGIDLLNEGGLVWVKRRSSSEHHFLVDTVRGANKYLQTSTTSAEQFLSSSIYNFAEDGFTVSASLCESLKNFASWSFRKSPKFFDVVTYTGNGVGSRAISHNLESSPGTVIIKRVSAAENWVIWHRSLDSNKMLTFTANAESGGTIAFDSSLMSSTTFGVNTDSSTNANGSTYVAYLFGHDAGGFGDDGEQNIISCGSYTGNGSSNGPEINLGWEPQFVLIKSANYETTWWMNDTMRGSTADGQTALLAPNTYAAEVNYTRFGVTSTGFKIRSSQSDVNANGGTYIYIAIRRPMKTPESGTEVFAIDYQGTGGVVPGYKAPFPVDMGIWRDRDAVANTQITSRLTNDTLMYTNSIDAQVSSASYSFDYQNGFMDLSSTDTTRVGWMFKRAPHFFDQLCYTGSGSSSRQLTHNLGVAPEMIIVRMRNYSDDYFVYHVGMGNTKYVRLNGNSPETTSSAFWDNTTPTDSVFTIGTNLDYSFGNYYAYLFSTLPGVSKVGSYTGTAADVNVDCGFSAGARFVLIKRTDSNSDWFVWDSKRGIVAGNDPYLFLNTTATEVTSTDYIDPLSSGFTVTSSAPSTLNAIGGNYIFLAIA